MQRSFCNGVFAPCVRKQCVIKKTRPTVCVNDPKIQRSFSLKQVDDVTPFADILRQETKWSPQGWSVQTTLPLPWVDDVYEMLGHLIDKAFNDAQRLHDILSRFSYQPPKEFVLKGLVASIPPLLTRGDRWSLAQCEQMFLALPSARCVKLLMQLGGVEVPLSLAKLAILRCGAVEFSRCQRFTLSWDGGLLAELARVSAIKDANKEPNWPKIFELLFYCAQVRPRCVFLFGRGLAEALRHSSDENAQLFQAAFSMNKGAAVRLQSILDKRPQMVHQFQKKNSYMFRCARATSERELSGFFRQLFEKKT